MEKLTKDEDIQTLVRLIAWMEVQARALEGASKSLRLMVGGWRLAAVPLDTTSLSPLSSPNFNDPQNPLDNPMVPDWDEDFLKQLLDAQQKAADFTNTCTAKFDQELQHAAQITNLTARAHAIAEAVQRYQECLRRPHPQQVVPPP